MKPAESHFGLGIGRLLPLQRQAEGVVSSREFKALFDRERALADRNSHHFSVLVLASSNGGFTASMVQTLVRALSERLRKTDAIGWVDRERLGILLPDTGWRGAWTVGQAICRGMLSENAELKCHVYVYPFEEDGGSNGGPTQLWLFPGQQNGSDGPGQAGSQPFAVRAGPISESDLSFLLGRAAPLWKRTLDVVGALVGLVIVSPLFLVCAAAIKMLSPGPVFFRQERVGHRGKRFMCWKLRTMKWQTDTGIHRQHLRHLLGSNVPMEKLDKRDDPRLIPVIGRLLRASAIDELPQLFNILRGDMSLVGPRPCLPYEYAHYLDWQKRRFDSLPGLTGLWQVSGKNRTTFLEMMRLDISYADGLSPWMDSHILLRTLPTLAGEVKQAMDGGGKG